jgi:hypothetical protein
VPADKCGFALYEYLRQNLEVGEMSFQVKAGIFLITASLVFSWENMSMANPATIVGKISRIEQLPPGVSTAAHKGRIVHFSDGSSARLDLGNPRSIGYGELLDDMRKAGIPAYVEVDPQTRSITRLLVPLVVTVGDITLAKSGQFVVELEISSAHHTLSPGNPGFERLLTTLQEARHQNTKLVVTESDSHEIIDARPADP